MAAAFTTRPNLISRFPPSLSGFRFAPPPQANPPPSIPPPPDPPPKPNPPTVTTSFNPNSKSPPFLPPKPNPPFPVPPFSSQAAASFPPPVKWSNLFAAKPMNAGTFSPPSMTLKFDGNRMVPSEEVVSAGEEVWSEYLVGFFLDKPLCFSVVSNYLINKWRPKGAIKIKSNGKVFFFHLSDHDDRKRIIEADPLIIRSKLFIIKPWSTTFNLSGNGIRNVPVWIKITDVPLYTWSLPGICWLATRVGKCLCLDNSTEKLERLEYAKCLVEITPESELPTDFLVLLPDGSEHLVKIEYVWKPETCSMCKVFGHNLSNCHINKEKSAAQSVVTGRIDKTSKAQNNVLPKKPSGPRYGSGFAINSNTAWIPTNNSSNKVASTAGPSLADKAAKVQTAGINKVNVNNINLSNMFGALDTLYENTRNQDGVSSNAPVDEECETLDEGNDEPSEVDCDLRVEEDSLQDIVECGTSVAVNLHTDVSDASARADMCGDSQANSMQELLNEMNNHQSTKANDASINASPNIVPNEVDKQASVSVLNAEGINLQVVVDVNVPPDENLSKHIAMANAVSKLVNERAVQYEAEQFDSFLQENFDVVQIQQVKERTKIVYGESAQETVDRLKSELASGLVTGASYVDKSETLEALLKSMSPGQSSMKVDENVKGKQKAFSNPVSSMNIGKKSSPIPFKPGFLNAQSPKSDGATVIKTNPYAHLIPPLAYKAPPVMKDPSSPQVASSSKVEAVQTPVTRSRKREMMRAQFEKG